MGAWAIWDGGHEPTRPNSGVLCSYPTNHPSSIGGLRGGRTSQHLSLKARPAPIWALAIAGLASQHPHPAPELLHWVSKPSLINGMKQQLQFLSGLKVQKADPGITAGTRVCVGCEARAATECNPALMDIRAHRGGMGYDYRCLQLFPLHHHPVLHSRNLSLFQP